MPAMQRRRIASMNPANMVDVLERNFVAGKIKMRMLTDRGFSISRIRELMQKRRERKALHRGK